MRKCLVRYFIFQKVVKWCILTEAEKKKTVKELESKWDYHESDIMEIFLSRLSGSDYAHK